MIPFTFKRKVIEGDPAHNGVKGDSFSCAIWDHFRSADFGFPPDKPLSFWKIMIFLYNPTPCDVDGCDSYSAYMVIRSLIGIIFRDQIVVFLNDQTWLKGRLDFVGNWIGKLEVFENALEIFLAVLADACRLYRILVVSFKYLSTVE